MSEKLIYINTHKKFGLLNLRKINFVKAVGAYTKIGLINSEEEMVSMTFGEFIKSNADLLENFVLVKRGLVVQLENISSIVKDEQKSIYIVFMDKTIFQINERLRSQLIRLIKQKLSNKQKIK